MDAQSAFNVAVGIAAFFGVYTLNSISASIKALQDTDKAVLEKIQAVEILVAGQYVKHSDVEKLAQALFTKLDKIETKLDQKADKS